MYKCVCVFVYVCMDSLVCVCVFTTCMCPYISYMCISIYTDVCMGCVIVRVCLLPMSNPTHTQTLPFFLFLLRKYFYFF